MNAPISSAICQVHEDRPATARCPSCHKFYCDECITEHEGRLTCSTCLAGQSGTEPSIDEDASINPWSKGLAWVRPFPILQLIMAICIIWLIFQLLARLLLSIPSDFHEGTIWEG